MSVYFPPHGLNAQLSLQLREVKNIYIYIGRPLRLSHNKTLFYKQEFTIDRIVYIMKVLCI